MNRPTEETLAQCLLRISELERLHRARQNTTRRIKRAASRVVALGALGTLLMGGVGLSQASWSQSAFVDCDGPGNDFHKVAGMFCFKHTTPARAGEVNRNFKFLYDVIAALGNSFHTDTLSAGGGTVTNELAVGSLKSGDTTISGTATVDGRLGAASAVVGGGTLEAGTAATVNGDASVSGELSAGTAHVTGSLTAASATLTGAVSAASAQVTHGMSAATAIIGGGALGSDKLRVQGDMTTTGKISANSLSVTNATVTGTLDLEYKAAWSDFFTIGNGGNLTERSVDCGTGYVAVGGGLDAHNDHKQCINLVDSFPSGSKWVVSAISVCSDSKATNRVKAVCLKIK